MKTPAVCVLAVGLISWSLPVDSATFTVTSTDDTGAGSLREAIENTNATAGADVIEFNISGDGPHTISPASALPEITDPVTIDGTTQPGFAGTPVIVINGQSAGFGSNGLVISAGTSTVRGLVINRFSGSAIMLSGAGSNAIEGNYIGVDAAGAASASNSGNGIVISESPDNTIGGTSEAARNVISGNFGRGVYILGSTSTGNQVLGNYIGTPASGVGKFSNFGGGIRIESASNNTIGGTSAGARNLISGQGNYGIELSSANENVIIGNWIGPDANGETGSGNGNGIGVNSSSSSNQIGGLGAGEANVIAFNTNTGVNVGFNSVGNPIRGNSIHDNTNLGIDLGNNGLTANDEGDSDSGGNNFQNFPVLTSAALSASNTAIEGTLNSEPNTEYQIDFYASRAPDGSGYGEGEEHLGEATVTTDANGDAAISVNVAAATVGRHISATATNPSGDTSEFSQSITATSSLSGMTFTVTNTDDSGEGSLRQAILEANASLGDDTIDFNLSGDAPFTIAPASPLPEITDPVTIDGTTQTGFVDAPVVFIDGADAGFQTTGLNVSAGNTTIRGLGIIGFRNGGIILTLGGNNVIQSNVIGLDPNNEFAGNVNGGVLINNSADNLIGGANEGEGNVLSGNTHGVVIGGAASTGNIVQGNFIGTDAGGVLNRGNGTDGVQIQSGANDNVIGGIGEGESNLIAFNGQRGVLVIAFSGANPVRNAIRGNSIHSNGGLGIQHGFNPNINDEGDGDVGANEMQNHPILSAASAGPGSVTVQGNLNSHSNTQYELDFFANQVRDASGNGEGLQYLGSDTVTTDGSGNAPIDVTFSITVVGSFISATATDPEGNTSEFSPCYELDSSTIPSATYTVINTDEEGEGSLRQAILNSNGNVASGPNTIDFAVPGDGPHTISLSTALPLIVQPVVIDGTTQTGFTDAPIIELTKDPNAPFLNASGLEITGGNTTVRGLVINGFGQDGIRLTTKGGNTIQGNYIGVDLIGAIRKENSRHGIAIVNSSDNLIGGTGAGAANVISSRAVGSSDAVFINDSTFSGDPTTINNQIIGNSIGTDATGSVNLGAGGPGVDIVSTSDTTIENNVIAYNGNGIRLQGGNRAVRNTITANRIFSNTSAGITLGFSFQLENDPLDADDGENHLQNFPVITSATLNAGDTVIGGTLNSLPDTQFTVEFFANQSCDDSGFGEGEQFLGATDVTTDSNGDASFNATLDQRAQGRFIAATATDSDGNTSQFSECFEGTPTAPGATFTVINTNDDGAGSLRQAIIDANTSPVVSGARHTIQFDLPGDAPFAIELASPLPRIVEPVLIDGASQPGYADQPVVELRGSNAGFGAIGLDTAAGGSTVRGLSILGFGGVGVKFSGKGANHLEGNFIGLDATGTGMLGNGRGVLIEDSPDNVIGGATAGARNYISGNGGHGIEIFNAGSTGNQVLGNIIGLNVDGDAARNSNNGVNINNAPANIVGGNSAAARNVISGNNGSGVAVAGAFGANSATDNQILGNYIGTDITGTEARPNLGAGVSLSGQDANTLVNANLISGNNSQGISISGTQNVITGNLVGTDVTGELPLGNSREGILLSSGSFNQVGGESAGQGNTIAFNSGDGVHLNDFSGRSNSVLGNSIHDNNSLGINLGFDAVTLNDEGDADQGSNLQQNFPVLTSAFATPIGTTVQGSLDSQPDTQYRIEFFASQVCDPTGYGEGRKYLGFATVTTDGTGMASINAALEATVVGGGGRITATATDPDGNTSEFSECVAAEVTIPGSTFTVTNLEDSGPGSLRQAITDSNATVSSGNTINFNIPASEASEGGVFTIAPLTALPALIGAATIDGFTQPGASANTLSQGSNAAIHVRLDGANATAGFVSASGLQLTGQGITVRGLTITGWTNGILITGSNNHVEGCSIGTDSSGTLDLQNVGAGIRLQNGASGNVIGGVNPGQRNLISGNGTQGIYLTGANDNQVLGNLIGTDATGLQGLENSSHGIQIDTASVGNVIGGTTAGAGNVIAFNRTSGVDVTGTGANVINNSIRGNSIFSNGGLGINLHGSFLVDNNDSQDPDAGANNLQNYPLIESATINANDVMVSGSLNSAPNTAFELDVYANAVCDASGNGEGRQYLGAIPVQTDANGDAAFNETLPVTALYDSITATATDPDGNTSEFSACFEAEINASSLAIDNVNVPEGDPAASAAALSIASNGETTEATFTVTLDQPADVEVSFDYATQAGTATAGVDYVETSGSLTIPIGQMFVQLTVPVKKDTEPESDETFTVELSNVSGARPLDTSGLGTIEDDDDPTMPEALIAEESFDYPTGLIGGRNGGIGWDDAWRSAFNDLVVEPGLEYTDAFGALLDAAGNAVSDSALSTSRALPMKYGDPGSRIYVSFLGRAEGTQSGGLRLMDTTIVDENTTSESAKVYIGKFSNQPNWAVQFFGLGGTSGSSTIPANQDTFIVVCLEFTESGVEGRLYVNPPLSGQPDTPDAVASGMPFVFDRITLISSNTTTFIDEIRVGKTWSSVTPLFFPRLTIDDVELTEGDSGTQNAVFTVTLSKAVFGTVMVDYQTANGTAESPADYADASGTLTFASGVTEQTITVPVNGELTEEPDETFTVLLSNAVNARIIDGEGVGTILDDDTPPVITLFNKSVFEGNAGANSTATFTARLSHAFKNQVTVNYATQYYTATEGEDYQAAAGTLTFPAGTRTQTFNVTIFGDDTPEDYEEFFVDLSDPVNATVSGPRATGTITNDDFTFEGIVMEGDPAPGDECRVFSEILTTPVVNDSGQMAFVATTDPCPNGIQAAQASQETAIFVADPEGAIRRVASNLFPEQGVPPYDGNFTSLNLNDEGSLVFFTGLEKPLTPATSSFDICVQDDVQPRFLGFNSQTGEYLYQDCARGILLQGTGTVVRDSCSATLTDEGADPEQPDRSIEVIADLGEEGNPDCTFGAEATIRTTAYALPVRIEDSDIRDSVCACPEESGSVTGPAGVVGLDPEGNYLTGIFVGEYIRDNPEQGLQMAGEEEGDSALQAAGIGAVYYRILQMLGFCPPLISGNHGYFGATLEGSGDRSLQFSLGRYSRNWGSDFTAAGDSYGYKGGHYSGVQIGPPGWPVAANRSGYFTYNSSYLFFQPERGPEVRLIGSGNSVNGQTVQRVLGDLITISRKKFTVIADILGSAGFPVQAVAYGYRPFTANTVNVLPVNQLTGPDTFLENIFFNNREEGFAEAQTFFTTQEPPSTGLRVTFDTWDNSVDTSDAGLNLSYGSLQDIDPGSTSINSRMGFATKEGSLYGAPPGGNFIELIGAGNQFNGQTITSVSKGGGSNGMDGRARDVSNYYAPALAEFDSGNLGIVGVYLAQQVTQTDSDGDGISDLDETVKYYTDPNKADTDGDGFSDGEEIYKKTDPNDPNDHPPPPAYNGFVYVIQGQADASRNRDDLIVSNIGSSGEDGVQFNFGAGVQGLGIEFDRLLFDATGSWFNYSFLYTVSQNNEPQEAGATLQNINGIPTLDLNLASFNEKIVEAQFFNDDTLVDTQEIPASGNAYTLAPGVELGLVKTFVSPLDLTAGVSYEFKQATQFTPAMGGDSTTANKVKFTVQNALVDSVKSATFLFNSLDNVEIEDLYTKKFDSKLSGVGRARLDFLEDAVKVSNLGSEGRDGVSARFHEVKSDVGYGINYQFTDKFNLSVGYSANYTLNSGSQNFSAQSATAEEIAAAAAPVPSEGPIGTADYAADGDSIQISADFSPIGSANVQVEVYGGGNLVGAESVPGGDVVAALSPEAGGTPQIIGVQAITSTPLPCLVFLLDRTATITPVGGAPLEGDEVRVCAETFDGAISALTRLVIRAGDIDSFTLTAEPEVRGPVLTVGLLQDGTLEISWEGTATLQTAPTVNGVWVSLLNAVSPYHVDPNAQDAAFYRLIVP